MYKKHEKLIDRLNRITLIYTVQNRIHICNGHCTQGCLFYPVIDYFFPSRKFDVYFFPRFFPSVFPDFFFIFSLFASFPSFSIVFNIPPLTYFPPFFPHLSYLFSFFPPFSFFFSFFISFFFPFFFLPSLSLFYSPTGWIF